MFNAIVDVYFGIYIYTYIPLVEQGRVLVQVRWQVGTGSRQDVLDWSDDRRAERGVAPQGQVVTREGSRGQEEQGGG